jgi:ribosome maturation factor RimP
LRVFLCQADGSAQGIDLQACTRVAKRINDLPNVEELMPGDSTLEVSSPGINRRLSRAEHFKGAVGERVRVTFKRMEDGAPKKDTVRGQLLSFDGERLEIERDEKKGGGRETVELSSIQEARVDFPFKADFSHS